MSTPPILIIGAGISGLILAQYLQRCGIPFEIFDRDSAFDARSGGWGLTLHWALPALRHLLPEHLVARLPETFVNKDAAARGDMGRFHFFDLKSGRALYDVPAEERIRVNRGRLRELLTSGLDVQVSWGSPLDGMMANTPSGTKPSSISSRRSLSSPLALQMDRLIVGISSLLLMVHGRAPGRYCILGDMR